MNAVIANISLTIPAAWLSCQPSYVKYPEPLNPGTYVDQAFYWSECWLLIDTEARLSV